MNVGVRELKAQLSDFLGRAAMGEDIVVTDRGKPVARLVAYFGESDLEKGTRGGWIEAPRRSRLLPVGRERGERSTLEVLAEDRG